MLYTHCAHAEILTIVGLCWQQLATLPSAVRNRRWPSPADHTRHWTVCSAWWVTGHDSVAWIIIVSRYSCLISSCSPLSFKRPLLSVDVSVCAVSSPVHPLLVDQFWWNLAVMTHLGSNSLLHPPAPPSGGTVNENPHFSLGSREMLLLLQFLIQFSDILV